MEGLDGSNAEKGSVSPCKPALLPCRAAASSSRAKDPSRADHA